MINIDLGLEMGKGPQWRNRVRLIVCSKCGDYNSTVSHNLRWIVCEIKWIQNGLVEKGDHMNSVAEKVGILWVLCELEVEHENAVMDWEDEQLAWALWEQLQYEEEEDLADEDADVIFKPEEDKREPFISQLAGKSIKEVIVPSGAGVAVSAAIASGGATAAEPAKEEESHDEMGFSLLFDG